MMVLRLVLAAVLAGAAILVSPTPTASAYPGPTCPGNGDDTVVLGASGGWCDFLHVPPPPGSHVSCRWADFSFLIGEIGGHNECRLVDANEQLLPGSPPWGIFAHWGDNERNPPEVPAPPPEAPAPEN